MTRWTLTWVAMMLLGLVIAGCERQPRDPVIEPSPADSATTPVDAPPAEPGS